MAQTLDELGRRLDLKSRMRDRVTRLRTQSVTGNDDLLVPAAVAASAMLAASLIIRIMRSRSS